MYASFSLVKHLTILTACAQFYTGRANVETHLEQKLDENALRAITQDLYFLHLTGHLIAMLVFATLDPIVRSYK